MGCSELLLWLSFVTVNMYRNGTESEIQCHSRRVWWSTAAFSPGICPVLQTGWENSDVKNMISVLKQRACNQRGFHAMGKLLYSWNCAFKKSTSYSIKQQSLAVFYKIEMWFMEKLTLNQELGSFELTTVTCMTESTWHTPRYFAHQTFLYQTDLGMFSFWHFSKFLL